MTHDVFISYSSLDKPAADAVCARLETDGVRSWIAPRDILPGSDWSEAIIDGIEGSRLMLLVFSSNSNQSQQVKREVERAVNKGLVIVPVRIQDVLPARNLEYFLSTPHWLDAMTPPFEQHLGYLSETVQFILSQPGDGAVPSPPHPVALPAARPAGVPRAALALALAAVAIGAVFGVRALLDGGDDQPGGGQGAPDSASIDPKFAGSWSLVTTPAEGPDQWTVSFRQDRTYSGEIVFEEKGTILSFDNQSPLPEPIGRPASRGTAQPFLTPDGGPGGLRGAAYTVNGKKVNASSILPIDFVAFAALGNPGNVGGLLSVTFDIVSDTEWKAEVTAGKVKWSVTFTAAGTKYTFRATHAESGTYEANSGKTRTVSSEGNVIDGTYSFQPDGSLVIKNDTGSGVWKKTE